MEQVALDQLAPPMTAVIFLPRCSMLSLLALIVTVDMTEGPMPITYIRAADGAAVSDSEALDSGRRLRSGYRFAPLRPGDYVGFEMAFLDHARPAPASVILNDNNSGRTPAPADATLGGARELRDAIRANRHNPNAMPLQLGGAPVVKDAAAAAFDGAAVRDLIRSSRNR